MIKPLFNNILVKVREADLVLKSEGFLTEVGDVVDVGSEVKEVKVGDTIAFSKWGVKSVEYDNETYRFIPEDGRFILGVIRVS